MFSFEPGLAFWTIITFLLFLFILKRYVLPPLEKVLQERQEQISNFIATAEKNKQEAAELVLKSKAELQKAYLDAEKYAQQAKNKQEELYQKQVLELKQNLENMKEKQAAELKKMEKLALDSLQEKVGNFITTACEKIIEKDLPAEFKKQVLDNSIESLNNLGRL